MVILIFSWTKNLKYIFFILITLENNKNLVNFRYFIKIFKKLPYKIKWCKFIINLKRNLEKKS